MRLLLLVPAVLLVGCTTAVPIKQPFPEVPPILMRECPNLQTVPESTEKLSDLLSTVNQNYSTYHECKYLLGRWQEWYQIHKMIYEQSK